MTQPNSQFFPSTFHQLRQEGFSAAEVTRLRAGFKRFMMPGTIDVHKDDSCRGFQPGVQLVHAITILYLSYVYVYVYIIYRLCIDMYRFCKFCIGPICSMYGIQPKKCGSFFGNMLGTSSYMEHWVLYLKYLRTIYVYVGIYIQVLQFYVDTQHIREYHIYIYIYIYTDYNIYIYSIYIYIYIHFCRSRGSQDVFELLTFLGCVFLDPLTVRDLMAPRAKRWIVLLFGHPFLHFFGGETTDFLSCSIILFWQNDRDKRFFD